MTHSESDSRSTQRRAEARHDMPVVKVFANGSSTRPPAGQNVCSNSLNNNGDFSFGLTSFFLGANVKRLAGGGMLSMQLNFLLCEQSSMCS